MLSYFMICFIFIVNVVINYDLLFNSENEGVENINFVFYYYFIIRFLCFFFDVLFVYV